MASRAGLVRANDHIVVVQMLAGAFVVKIVSVDEQGHGIQAIRPKSLVDLMMARPHRASLASNLKFFRMRTSAAFIFCILRCIVLVRCLNTVGHAIRQLA